MSADSDDADFVFYGTKLQAEEEATSRRHEFQKKDVASAAGSRSLPVWKQVYGCISGTGAARAAVPATVPHAGGLCNTRPATLRHRGRRVSSTPCTKGTQETRILHMRVIAGNVCRYTARVRCQSAGCGGCGGAAALPICVVLDISCISP